MVLPLRCGLGLQPLAHVGSAPWVVFGPTFIGFGNLPDLTHLHKVAGDTGMIGASLPGFFTSCDSRRKALPGIASIGVMGAALPWAGWRW